jgi:signal transduction histidine kinase
MVRALAVVVAHALRAADADVSSASRPVRVRATLEETVEGSDSSVAGGRIRIDVEHGSREVTPSELEALFARQSTSRGRGLTLGLSLARSVIELHGGNVLVDRAPDGAAIARCGIPLVVQARDSSRASNRKARAEGEGGKREPSSVPPAGGRR